MLGTYHELLNQLKIEKMELKFKAQRKHNSENVYFNLKYFLENDEATMPNAFQYVLKNIRQFTGFKDKNEVEIYAGDIIGDWTDVDGKMEQSKQTVYFDEMLGGWMLDNSLKQDRSLCYSLHSELQDFEYEIIGNIYENPELLPT